MEDKRRGRELMVDGSTEKEDHSMVSSSSSLGWLRETGAPHESSRNTPRSTEELLALLACKEAQGIGVLRSCLSRFSHRTNLAH